jgi:hypothetical protein
MFSLFEYLRRLVKEAVFAGLQDAFEILDQGDYRTRNAEVATRFLNHVGFERPAEPAPVTQTALPPAGAPALGAPAPRVPHAAPAAAPTAPADLIPDSLALPAPEIPHLDGYQGFERRKKGGSGGAGRTPKPPEGRRP